MVVELSYDLHVKRALVTWSKEHWINPISLDGTNKTMELVLIYTQGKIVITAHAV